MRNRRQFDLRAFCGFARSHSPADAIWRSKSQAGYATAQDALSAVVTPDHPASGDHESLAGDGSPPAPPGEEKTGTGIDTEETDESVVRLHDASVAGTDASVLGTDLVSCSVVSSQPTRSSSSHSARTFAVSSWYLDATRSGVMSPFSSRKTPRFLFGRPASWTRMAKSPNASSPPLERIR